VDPNNPHPTELDGSKTEFPLGRMVTLLVLIICIAASALMLSLPPTSVDVNAVYRNF